MDKEKLDDAIQLLLNVGEFFRDDHIEERLAIIAKAVKQLHWEIEKLKQQPTADAGSAP